MLFTLLCKYELKKYEVKKFFVVVVLVFWFLHYQWKRRHLYHHASKIPGSRGWPIVGNLFQFTGDSDETHDKILKYLDACKDISKAWMGPTLVCGIVKPEYLAKCFMSPSTTARLYFDRKVTDFLGQGLLTAPIPVWKRHRKIIHPFFSDKIINRFVEVFGRQSITLGEQLEKYLGQKNVDIFEIVRNCTLDISFETMLGVQLNVQQGESELGRWTDRLLEIMFLRLFNFWYQYDFFFKWTKLHKENQLLLTKYQRYLEEIIGKKGKSVKSDFVVLLDFLLDLSRSGTKITTEEILDEVKTFVIGSFDTTALLSCFTITMLGMHPDVQNRVYEEVLTVLGPERTPDYQDLPSLKYTELVLKETLRLFPPSPCLERLVLEDLPLDGDDITLPKGSVAMLAVLPVHRNTKYWPDPLKFDPDRFSPERSTNRHPFTYMPFSAGPMNCIGRKYGIMSTKTIIAILIRKFKFRTEYKTVDDIKLGAKLILRPRDGFKCSFDLR
ncbi:hypothetical protein Zmor_016796 [Zophobas morio]|uniref:Uncharacterized protein n=1 Tax=Zophobas morio TaxID=2755281 RepID=A0AA38IB72_9CUCU|nr:hypothetical protein Zmor_016796 [Zophobas morio]